MAAATLKAWSEHTFKSFAGKTALRFLRAGKRESELSYAALDADCNRCANAFLRMGVAKGDRVVLFLDKSLLLLTAHFALQRIGAISVPLNPGFKKPEMEYLLHDAEPKMILCDPQSSTMVSQIAPQSRVQSVDTAAPYAAVDFFRSCSPKPIQALVRPEDPALIIYTSGTTGHPKGAVLTQANLVHDAQNIVSIWEITPADVLCHALPLFHVHGLCFALHTTLLTGSRVILLDRFAPQTLLDVLSRTDTDAVCTLFMAVPAIYTKLMDALDDRRPDFSHLRLWASGSAPLLVKDFERIKALLGQEPVEREGMSETGMNFSNPLHGRRKPGSIGLPLPQLQVRVVDPDSHADVAPGQIGELWLKSPAITPGYWRKPRETAEAFVQGWFRTGDLGRTDADGYYYLTDRLKHIIITGGENVSAKEVETVVNAVAGVVECAVVGIPDEKWGEKVVAAVVAEPGSELSAESIQTVCRQHLHDWKCPKQIIFVEEIPKNTMGKVLKEVVKKRFVC